MTNEGKERKIKTYYKLYWASLVTQTVKNLPAMQKTQVRFLGWEDPLEEKTATHSSTLAWRIPWTEEPGGLQSMGSPRVEHNWVTNTFTFIKFRASLVRTGHRTTDWFQIGKGVRQGYILLPCLFNLYAEYIMRNAGLEEAQAGIKPGEISVTSDMQTTPPLWQKVKKN